MKDALVSASLGDVREFEGSLLAHALVSDTINWIISN